MAAQKNKVKKSDTKREAGAGGHNPSAPSSARPSSLVDTRVIYCGDNLDQLKKLPDNCVDLIYIDPPFNSNRNYEVFWGETKEKRAFEDRHRLRGFHGTQKKINHRFRRFHGFVTYKMS